MQKGHQMTDMPAFSERDTSDVTDAPVPSKPIGSEPICPVDNTPAVSAEPVRTSSDGVPLWFWPLGFLVVFVVDAALVLALVVQGQDLVFAAGVPGALTVVTLGVLRALSGHMGRRQG